MAPPKGPMLLPKGIVLNTNTIYDSIARYDVLPPETMHQCWKIYTTTHRKLRDPTARRLENCWWRIWGSDCRYLKGEIVASVYRHISTGPTVVPIKGPENRWEPGQDDEEEEDAKDTKEDKQEAKVEAKQPLEQQHQQPQQKQQLPQRPGNVSAATTKPSTDVSGKPRPTTVRTHSENAQVTAPLHPILKKSNQSSGKRQVTRFALTPTETTAAVESDVSSGSTTAVAAPPPAEPVRQASVPPLKKKHVTMTHTKRLMAVKKRPVLPRRQSSQSSGGSDAGAQGGASQRFAPVVGSPHALTKVSDGSTETLLEADEEEEEAKPAPKAAVKKLTRPAPGGRFALSKAAGPVKKPSLKQTTTVAPVAPTAVAPVVPAAVAPTTVAPQTSTSSKAKTVLPSIPPSKSGPIQPSPEPKKETVKVEAIESASAPEATSSSQPINETTTLPTSMIPSMPIATSSMMVSSSYTPATTGTSVPTESNRPPPARMLPPQSSRPHSLLLSKSAGSIAPLMGRSQSQQGSGYRPGSRFASLVQPMATTSNISAQGILLDLESTAPPTLSEIEKQSPPSMAAPIGPPPVQPSRPAATMSRTKSQLQILLGQGGGASDRLKRNSRG